MPTVRNGDVTLQYGIGGDGETVAFVGGFGYGPWQWAWQYGAVAGPFEALVLATRGTGASDSGASSRSQDLGTLVGDVDAVLSDAGARRVHLVGSGLGGMVALEYAMTRNRARSLTLLGTGATGEALRVDPVDRLFAPRNDPERLHDSLDAVLSAEFLEERSDAVESIVEWRAEEDADRNGWEALTDAARGFDLSDRLYEITVPALVIHGEDDRVIAADAGRQLADGLPRGEFVEEPGAGHLVGIEQSASVNDRLRGWLETHGEPSF